MSKRPYAMTKWGFERAKVVFRVMTYPDFGSVLIVLFVALCELW